MYLNDDQVSRPEATPNVSPCGKGIISCFSVSFLGEFWGAEVICKEDIQLLVQSMLACARSRTWIQLLWSKSVGTRLYAYQKDLLDRSPIHCNDISRESGSREEGDELWSTKEETHVRPGHNWMLKFGRVSSSISCVDKEFKVMGRK